MSRRREVISMPSAPSMLLALLAFVGLCGAKAPSDEADMKDVLIHADLPLYNFADDGFWPQHFSDDDGNFGCSSRIGFGDWKFARYDDEIIWLRLTNYGVFHCAMIESWANERENLKTAHYSYSFFVKIGEIRQKGNLLELWALQSGSSPGSKYTLLARPVDPARITSFVVLQRACPKSHWRVGPAMDTWQTSYCAINTKADLLSLAKKMAALPPLGTLTLIGSPLEQKE